MVHIVPLCCCLVEMVARYSWHEILMTRTRPIYEPLQCTPVVVSPIRDYQAAASKKCSIPRVQVGGVEEVPEKAVDKAVDKAVEGAVVRHSLLHHGRMADMRCFLSTVCTGCPSTMIRGITAAMA